MMDPKTRLMDADETLSPVDLPGASQLIGGRPLAWTSVTIAVATLFLLLTNAVSLNGWAAELTPSDASARLIAVTERWQAFSDGAGLGSVRAQTHALWKRGQAARFGAERPDQS